MVLGCGACPFDDDDDDDDDAMGERERRRRRRKQVARKKKRRTRPLRDETDDHPTDGIDDHPTDELRDDTDDHPTDEQQLPVDSTSSLRDDVAMGSALEPHACDHTPPTEAASAPQEESPGGSMGGSPAAQGHREEAAVTILSTEPVAVRTSEVRHTANDLD